MLNLSTDFVNSAPRDIRNVRLGKKKWPYIVLVIVVVVVILGLISVPYASMAFNIYEQANLGKQDLEEAQKLAASLKFEQAGEYVDSAIEHFSLAKQKFIAYKIFLWVPWVGTQVRAVDNILTTSLETSKAIADLLELAQDIFEVFEYTKEVTGGIVPEVEEHITFADLTREQRREILKQLYESVPKLQEAKVKIDLAMTSFERIPQTQLAEPIRKAVEPFAQYLPEFKRQIDFAVPLLKIIPQVAGYPASKNYLVLFSNNAELRPAGGFLGTYGILKVADGEIISFDTHDIYAIDGPSESFMTSVPPPPISQYLKVNAWYMRDSNWSPDFPESAEKVLWFYSEEASGIAREREGPIPEAPLINFNGVISLNPDLVAQLLTVTGPITIEDQTFTSENMFHALEYHVEVGFLEEGIPRFQRKEIISALSTELQDKLFSLPAARWFDVMKILQDALLERHFIIYEKDPDIQSEIESQNWDGGVREYDGDFLMVVDANLASLKTDPYVERNIKYELGFDEMNDLIGKVTINYKNTATFTWKTTRYRTYTRVYAPQGSELLSATGHLKDDKLTNPNLEPGTVDVYDELGKTVFGAFTSIEPGAQGELTFSYKLPDSVREMIRDREYSLFIEKQAGAEAPGLTLSLEFDKNLESAEPPEEQVYWGDRRYNVTTDLRVDREFQINF